MGDEEKGMSRPISQRWGTPFRDVKYEDPASDATRSQGQNNNTLSCGLQAQPLRLFHAGFRPHFPARFEPMEDRGERRNPGPEDEEDEEQDRREAEEEEHWRAERPEEQAGISTEARIGRKLREIGDQFDQDHLHQFLRHQRDQLPIWMRLTMALYGFLFQREAPVPPQLRGGER
ncbi:BCL2 modifying factor 2 [Osmerus mordax]|uniref:BCL2 modifying factor 2 n=1 Tax=Osmerus mordax TaxID=8014 RepID=UPI00350EFE9F